MAKTEGPYSSMKCGACLRTYEIPKPRKQHHHCPACGTLLCLSVSPAQIDNWNAFLLWEDRARAELERAFAAKSITRRATDACQ